MSPAPQLEGLRVLIVDDDPDTLELNELIVQKAGGSAFVAADIRQAIEAFRTKRPDVLLCDLNLGESADGCDLIRSLRDVLGRPIPAIALSGTPRHLAEERALKSGFAAYVEKPVTPAVLTKAIKKASTGA